MLIDPSSHWSGVCITDKLFYLSVCIKSLYSFPLNRTAELSMVTKLLSWQHVIWEMQLLIESMTHCFPLLHFFSQVTARTTKTQHPCELHTQSLQPVASTTLRWRLSAKGEMGKCYNSAGRGEPVRTSHTAFILLVLLSLCYLVSAILHVVMKLFPNTGCLTCKVKFHIEEVS